MKEAILWMWTAYDISYGRRWGVQAGAFTGYSESPSNDGSRKRRGSRNVELMHSGSLSHCWYFSQEVSSAGVMAVLVSAMSVA